VVEENLFLEILPIIAGVAVAVLVVIASLVLFDRLVMPKPESAIRQRGFEVKRTTGQPPVLMKERENDHG
jgi:hypothetical protein